MHVSFSSFSFGCRVNEAEKEELDRQLLKAGFEYTSQNPDIYLLNTCAVTHKAEREARQHIFQVKKKFPEAKIVVTGCSATHWKQHKLHDSLPVDILIDNVNKEYLVSLLMKQLSIKTRHNTPQLITNTNNTNKFVSSGRYPIKIQDGCQRFCSYCIVPYLRGLPQSVSTHSIVEKIKSLPEAKEIILTAINTEAFGYDSQESFVELLKSVIDNTIIPRISLGSVHPWSITEEFYDFYNQYQHKKRLVDYFHVPVQSGSNKLLRLMKRGYSKEEFIQKIDQLHKINPQALFATDVIVGFLDENDADFDDTYDMLSTSKISKFHVFRFSNRQNTASWYMKKSLCEPSASIKEKRSKILLDLGKRKYNTFLKTLVDKSFPSLILDREKEGYKEALLSNQVPILIKNTKNNPGTIVTVRVVNHTNGILYGI